MYIKNEGNPPIGAFGGRRPAQALRLPRVSMPEWNDSFPFWRTPPTPIPARFALGKEKGPPRLTRRALLQIFRQIEFTNNSEATDAVFTARSFSVALPQALSSWRFLRRTC